MSLTDLRIAGLIKLSGTELEQAHLVLRDAAIVAQRSTCKNRRCGAIIIHGFVVGKGYNSPPKDQEVYRRCEVDKSFYSPKVTDRTCCIHAEVRAIIDALETHPRELRGSTIYFTSINEKGEMIPSGHPYCTVCSKLALEVGIDTWILEHEDGVYAYDAGYYNDISYVGALE